MPTFPTARRAFLLALAAFAANSPGQAQTEPAPAGPPARTAFVRVDAPAGEAAAVVVGGLAAGRAGDVLAVPADSAVTVALVEAGAAWNPRRAEVTVSVPAGDTLAVGLALPVRVRIETRPSRAAVALVRADGTRQALGTSPLAADLAAGTAGVLVATLGGYREARVALDASTAARRTTPVTLLLVPDGGLAAGSDGGPDGAPAVTVLPARPRRTGFVDAGIGVLALAAGAVAVAAKFRADGLDDRYRDPASAERGSASLRADAARLDRVSLAALGVMQLGVGVLALRFVLR